MRNREGCDCTMADGGIDSSIALTTTIVSARKQGAEQLAIARHVAAQLSSCCVGAGVCWSAQSESCVEAGLSIVAACCAIPASSRSQASTG